MLNTKKIEDIKRSTTMHGELIEDWCKELCLWLPQINHQTKLCWIEEFQVKVPRIGSLDRVFDVVNLEKFSARSSPTIISGYVGYSPHRDILFIRSGSFELVSAIDSVEESVCLAFEVLGDA